MCRLSIGNTVVPGGEHFPREGAFVRLAGEKRTNNKVFLRKAPRVSRHVGTVSMRQKMRIKLERGMNIFSTPFYRRWP